MSDDKQPFDIIREIEKLMREMVEKSDDPNSIPKVFGFAITNRDDMDPEIHKIMSNFTFPPGMFNSKPNNRGLHYEVLEHDGKIYVTVDVGDLDEDELSVSCDDDLVTILVDESGLKEEILLPGKVLPEPSSKTVSNGVLEIIFEILDTEVDVEI